MSDEYIFWVSITVAFCTLAMFVDALYIRFQVRRERKRLEDERIVERIKERFKNPEKILPKGAEIRIYVSTNGEFPQNVKMQYRQHGNRQWKDIP